MSFIIYRKKFRNLAFGTEYIRQEVLNKIKDKSITHNICRIQGNEFIMCGFYCVAFIDYMLAGKTYYTIDYNNYRLLL